MNILEHINFDIDENDFVCYPWALRLRQTILLNVIAGFQAPDIGKVIIVGNRHAKPGPDVGAVFQQPNLFHGCQMKEVIHMSWTFLLLGIFFEILGTTPMKFSAGFSKLVPSIFLFLFYGLSLTFVTLSLKKIDVSIAYAVWSGLGTVLITAVSVYYFKEPMTFAKIFFILMIIGGVIGLNFSFVNEHEQGSEVPEMQRPNN